MITIAPLSLDDLTAWSDLLALTFDRSPEAMIQLLCWLHQLAAPDDADKPPVVAYGAWDGDRLVAQYACLLRTLQSDQLSEPVLVGMSLNMAVHPDYRGQGLIKQVSAPVYEAVQARNGIAGVGFSNADGVKVDRRSKGYGYAVVGQMIPTLIWLPAFRSHRSAKTQSVRLTHNLPVVLDESLFNGTNADGSSDSRHSIQFIQSAAGLRHRYEQHPFRQYEYGIWQNTNGSTRGVVIYRHIRTAHVPGVALLGAYAHPDDLGELLRQWADAVRESGARIIHVLTSEGSGLRSALSGIGVQMRAPISRSPSYLTVKPLTAPANDLMHFSAWDCVGGEIL